MAQRFYNTAYGVLAGPVIPEGNVIVLNNHSGFPTSLPAGDWFSLTVLSETSRYGSNIEIMKVTAVRVAGDNLELTVLRGQDGTQALGHDSGEKAEARITRMSLESLLADAMAHANERIQGLTDSAPEALDTLKELADALNNDPNFAANVTNELSKKLNAASYTAEDVRAKLLTVDGPGSGIDADLLDGKQLATIVTERDAKIAADITAHGNSTAHDNQYFRQDEFESEMVVNAPMRRNASGDVWARLFRSSFTSLNANIGVIYTSNAAGTDYIRPSSPAQVKAALGLTNADVGLNNVSNAAQVTVTGNQGIAGVKTFSGSIVINGSSVAPDLTVNRTNATTNANMLFQTTSATDVRIGQGDSGWFAIGSGDDIRWSQTGVFRVGATTGNTWWKGTAYGNGSGITDINASNIASGTIDFARVPSTTSRTSTSSNHALAASAMNAHRTSTDHDDQYPPLARTIGAGNGLTGGGSLEANRTLSLGTPGWITATSTNSTTATSHTHAISASTIGELTSDLPTGSIGSYGLFRRAVGMVESEVVAGSALRYASAGGNFGDQATPAGTWRSMGRLGTSDTSFGDRVTLFLRIS